MPRVAPLFAWMRLSPGRRLAAGFALLCLAGGAPATAGPELVEGTFVERMVLVRFADGVTEVDRAQFFDAVGAFDLRHLPRLDFWAVQLSRLSTREVIAAWEDSPLIDVIEANGIMSAEGTIPADPEFLKQWHLRNTGQQTTSGFVGTPGADIRAPRAWCSTQGDSNVLVAVLDTGVRWDHPDLVEALFVNDAEIADNGIDDDGNGYVDDIHGWNFGNVELNEDSNDTDDPHGHGTLIAGIIGAASDGEGAVGIAPGVRILPVTVLPGVETSPPSGTHFQAAMGIQYAVDMGADILNCSFGSNLASSLVRTALEEAELQQVTVVCAAGNSGRDVDERAFYPACFPLSNIISVASTNPDDTFAFNFSNWGPSCVDVAAPGVDVWGAIHRRTDPFDLYGSASGTSFAAPQVTGAVALLESLVPDLEHPTVLDLISASVDLQPGFASLVGTAGRLNAHQMLLEVQEPDAVAPAVVTDLHVANYGANWIELEWTAPGDDGAAGTACCYDLRFDTTPIVDFGAAPALPQPPDPVPGGSVQRYRVEGLEKGTSYWFRLTTSDEAISTSNPSNETTGTTLDPILEVDGAVVDAVALTGETGTYQVVVENLEASPLDFTIQTNEAWLTPRVTGGTLAASETRVFDFDWDATGLWGATHRAVIEVSDAARLHPVGTTATLVVVPAPEITVSSLTLDLGSVFVGFPTGVTTVVRNQGFVDLHVDSITPSVPGFSAFPSSFSLPPGGELTLDVTLVPEAPGPTSGTLTIESDDPFQPQTILSVSGVGVPPPILSFSPDSVFTTAVTGTEPDPVPVVISNPQIGGPDLTASFWLSSPGNWLSLDVSDLTIPAGGSDTLNLQVSLGTLGMGLYEATVSLSSNDPSRGSAILPVTLDVDGIPGLEVSTTRLDFGEVPAGTFAEQDFGLSNPGTDTLFVEAAIDGDFSVDPPLLALPPGESGEVRVRYRPPDAAADLSQLRLTTNDPVIPEVAFPAEGSAFAASAWSGTILLDRGRHVPVGETLTIEAGTVIEFYPPPGGRAGGPLAIEVLGGLSIEGTRERPVEITAPDGWAGIDLRGEASLRHVVLENALTGVSMEPGAALTAACVTLDGGDVGLDYPGGAGTSAHLFGVTFRNRLVNLRVEDLAGLTLSDPRGDRAGRNTFFQSDDPDGGLNIEHVGAPGTAWTLAGNAWLAPGNDFLDLRDLDRIEASIVGVVPLLMPVLSGVPGCDATLLDTPPEVIPDAFAFAASLANPVRELAPIDFDLPSGFAGFITLDVYDVRGAHVVRLEDRLAGAGRHTSVWTLRDGGGRRVGSGVYFLRLSAGPHQGTRKVVVLN